MLDFVLVPVLAALVLPLTKMREPTAWPLSERMLLIKKAIWGSRTSSNSFGSHSSSMSPLAFSTLRMPVSSGFLPPLAKVA